MSVGQAEQLSELLYEPNDVGANCFGAEHMKNWVTLNRQPCRLPRHQKAESPHSEGFHSHYRFQTLLHCLVRIFQSLLHFPDFIVTEQLAPMCTPALAASLRSVADLADVTLLHPGPGYAEWRLA